MPSFPFQSFLGNLVCQGGCQCPCTSWLQVWIQLGKYLDLQKGNLGDAHPRQTPANWELECCHHHQDLHAGQVIHHQTCLGRSQEMTRVHPLHMCTPATETLMSYDHQDKATKLPNETVFLTVPQGISMHIEDIVLCFHNPIFTWSALKEEIIFLWIYLLSCVSNSLSWLA